MDGHVAVKNHQQQQQQQNHNENKQTNLEKIRSSKTYAKSEFNNNKLTCSVRK